MRVGYGFGCVRRRRGGTPTPTPTTPAVSKWAVEGCSFDNDSDELANYALNALGATYQTFAVGGSGITEFNSRLSTIAAANCSGAVSGPGGPNDLLNFPDVPTALSTYLTYWTNLKAALVGAKLLVIHGIPPIDESAAGGFPGYNAKRVAFNAGMRAMVGNGVIDAYVPTYEDPVTAYNGAFNMPSGNTSDGIHPISLCLAAANASMLAALTAIISQAGQIPATVPSAFVIPDVSNADLSTAYSQRFLVTGLGLGKAASCSVSSGAGLIARGIDGYPAAGASTPFAIMCGDRVTVTNTSSGSYVTAVSTTISVAGVTDVFDITTKSAAPVELTPTFSTGGADIYSGYSPASGMRDGVFDQTTSVWACSAQDALRADLGSPTTVNEIRIAPSSFGSWNASNTDGCTLDYSNDGVNWTNYTTISGTAINTYKSYNPGINARYWRCRATSGGFGSLSEFRFFT